MKHIGSIDSSIKDEIKKNVAAVVVGDMDSAFDGYWTAREIVKQLKKEGIISKDAYRRFVRNMTTVFKDRFGIHPSKVMISRISVDGDV